MVRHLAKGQNANPVFLRRSAENREMHQVVADAIEKDDALSGPLVTMIQNTFDYDSFSSFHPSKVQDIAISECAV
ncbi:MAG: hypothetical protein J6T02_02900 [Bacteroidales bacterium]|nr:hypothetical protein [Bacteroidales bacterium]